MCLISSVGSVHTNVRSHNHVTSAPGIWVRAEWCSPEEASGDYDSRPSVGSFQYWHFHHYGTTFHNQNFVIPPFITSIPLSKDEQDCRRSMKTRPTTPNVALQRTSLLFRILEIPVQASAKRWGRCKNDFCQFPRSFKQMTVFTLH